MSRAGSAGRAPAPSSPLPKHSDLDSPPPQLRIKTQQALPRGAEQRGVQARRTGPLHALKRGPHAASCSTRAGASPLPKGLAVHPEAPGRCSTTAGASRLTGSNGPFPSVFATGNGSSRPARFDGGFARACNPAPAKGRAGCGPGKRSSFSAKGPGPGSLTDGRSGNHRPTGWHLRCAMPGRHIFGGSPPGAETAAPTAVRDARKTPDGLVGEPSDGDRKGHRMKPASDVEPAEMLCSSSHSKQPPASPASRGFRNRTNLLPRFRPRHRGRANVAQRRSYCPRQ